MEFAPSRYRAGAPFLLHFIEIKNNENVAYFHDDRFEFNAVSKSFL